MEKEIGGYFQLELSRGKLFHEMAFQVNSGRNALKCLLRQKSLSYIYLPYYSCDALLEAVEQEGWRYSYYYLDSNGLPIVDAIEQKFILLYINYFGLFRKESNITMNIYNDSIIDCTQAFFFVPSFSQEAFYSHRKFFGVPDGGCFYSKKSELITLDRDDSSDRMSHLLTRWTKGAREGYEAFLQNEKQFSDLPVQKMSVLTEAILRNVTYEQVRLIRDRNFEILHEQLGNGNQFELIHLIQPEGPFAYPYLSPKKGMRAHLISRDVFIPQLWPEVLKRAAPHSMEFRWAEEMVPLPVDQRYQEEDMRWIIQLIKEYEMKS